MALHSNTDWDAQVVIGKKAGPPKVAKDEATVNAARRAGASIDAAKKNPANSTGAAPDHQRIAKLDRTNDVAPPATVKPSVGKAMSQARMDLKMTQKELASATSEKPSVVNDYEAGRAVPSPAILAKFERVLKVKLRGSDIGSPLAPRGKKN